MSQKVRSVITRAHTAVKPYFFVCKNPFHDAWSSPDSSRKANPVRANLLQPLSAVAGMTVAAICRACKDQAGSRIEIISQAFAVPSCKSPRFCEWVVWRFDFDTFTPCLFILACPRSYIYHPRIKRHIDELLTFSIRSATAAHTFACTRTAVTMVRLFCNTVSVRRNRHVPTPVYRIFSEC